MKDIRLSADPLDPSFALQVVASPGAGGTTAFVGTVRDKTQGKQVVRLEFEAYEPMALSEMNKIADQIIEKWSAIAVAIHHRVGVLEIGEIPVIIAVATPHRKAAFEACEFAIDKLKQTVPIWKKEIFEDGEIWVAAHP